MDEQDAVLDERDMAIISYVDQKAGINKEEVKKEMGKRGVSSYVVTQKHIDDLIIRGIIKAIKDPPNARSYKLYVNHNNTILKLITGSRHFQRAFLVVVRKIKEYIHSIQARKRPNKVLIESLIDSIIDLYIFASQYYLKMSRTLWYTYIEDKQSMIKVNGEVFTRLAEVYSDLRREFNDVDIENRLTSRFNEWSEHAHTFASSGLWNAAGANKEFDECCDSIMFTSSGYSKEPEA